MPDSDASRESEWETFARELGVNIQRLRRDVGLSQEDVAARSGLSRYTYQKLEAGTSRPHSAANPRIRSLIAVAQALDVNISDLLPDTIPDLRAR